MEDWKVCSSFWSKQSIPGKEVLLNQRFQLGKHQWVVPVMYVCAGGLVLDFCMEADSRELSAFIDKWDLLHEEENHYTEIQREQMEREHPLNGDIRVIVILDGIQLCKERGYMTSWIPESCLKGHQYKKEIEQALLKHYGFDQNQGWAFHRHCYSWGEGLTPPLKHMMLQVVDTHSSHTASIEFDLQ